MTYVHEANHPRASTIAAIVASELAVSALFALMPDSQDPSAGYGERFALSVGAMAMCDAFVRIVAQTDKHGAGSIDEDDSSAASARRDRDRTNDQRERDLRNEAAPMCDQGDAHACLTVAIYDERHGRPATAVLRDYQIACTGNLAFGCYGAGRLTRQPGAALPLLERGCELGERASCEAAATNASRDLLHDGNR